MAEREIIRTTCPRDCYDSCGIAVVLDDGVVRKVLGDPKHPVSRGALCGKCAIAYNGIWRDPQARLSQPLKRSGPKGSGAFEPVTWEAALADIATRLQATVESSGPETILHSHYTGTCTLIAGSFPQRFFSRLGATEIDPDTVCNNAGHVALDYLYGASARGFDPRTAKDSKVIIVWGANPSASAPHAHKHWLKESPAQVIVVDPIRHDTAADADHHLQVRPGSDAALAFAMMHVFQRDGLLDHDFIGSQTEGWDELSPQLDACTPAWAAKQCGIPVEQIEQVAQLYAEGPSLLWLGQGLQRQPLGGNVMRACGTLPALTGNLGKPGAGVYYLNGSGPRNIDDDYVAAPQLCQGEAKTISHMDLADTLADPNKAQVFFSWNMNVAASGPRQADLRQALARENLFSVVVDLFMTDTALAADYVLPAASFLEFDDLMVPYFHYSLSAQVKAEEPPGEALPNQEIFRRLALAMGYNEPELTETDESILSAVLQRSGLGIDFADLAAAGTLEPFDEPIEPWAEGRYPTPSGKIEIASARAEADGHPRVPLPDVDPAPRAGHLRLLSPASRWQMNDSYGNDPKVLEKLGVQNVALHPDDAAALAIVEGASVRLENETGSLNMTVRISDEVPPGAALSHKGRWPSLDDAGANVNVLNPGHKTDMGESSAVHAVEVRVVPLSAAPHP